MTLFLRVLPYLLVEKKGGTQVDADMCKVGIILPIIRCLAVGLFVLLPGAFAGESSE